MPQIQKALENKFQGLFCGAGESRTLVQTWSSSSLLHVYSVLIFEKSVVSDIPKLLLIRKCTISQYSIFRETPLHFDTQIPLTAEVGKGWMWLNG